MIDNKEITSKLLARKIDHTNLKPDATSQDIVKACNEAIEHGFYAVCVNPGFVELAAKELHGTNVKVCTVIGFPLGATLTKIKALETEECILKGADEIDMVFNISFLKERNITGLVNEISAIATICNSNSVILKCIIETCLLSREEIVIASLAAKKAGAAFVKTSTGFSTGGAEVEDVALIRKTVGSIFGVKASGGIGTRDKAIAMLKAGASRIGTSKGVDIVKSGEQYLKLDAGV